MTWIDYRSSKPIKYHRKNISEFDQQTILNLTSTETKNLFYGAVQIPFNPYKEEQREQFITDAQKLTTYFSAASKTLIEKQLHSGFGAVLVTGLPIDRELPTTPEKGGSLHPDYKKTFVSEAMMIALGALTGAEPFNFRQEGRGTSPLIDNIIPVKALKEQKGAGGFVNNFPFHCESAWHRKRPDFLVLLGIKKDVHAKTIVFSSTMFEGTSWVQDAKQINGWFRLKAPELYVQMESQGIPMGTGPYSFRSPIEVNNGEIKLNINFNGTDCIDERAVSWLSDLEDFIEEKAVGVVLSPGLALILNNDLTCHTRNGYEPQFNGNDRWFQRGYFKKDLWTKKSDTDASTIDISEEIFNSLVDKGWMSPDKSLTKEFSRYVLNCEEVRSLKGSEMELSKIALHFTPIQGSRIV